MINLRSVVHCFLQSSLTLSILCGCAVRPQPERVVGPTSVNSNGIPKIEAWEANMRTFGKALCDRNKIGSLGLWEGNVWYYDGVRVFYQIEDYTSDAQWAQCAGYVRALYRDYVLSHQGKIGGWRVFPIGLAEDYKRNGDPQSRAAVLMLADNSAYAQSAGGPSYELSRETAYIIHAYLSAEELGHPKTAALQQAVSYAIGHLDQWTGSQKADYVKPFMVGLTMEALIRYVERHPDPRIQPVVTYAADWLWQNAWNPSLHTFPYIICRHNTSHAECHEDHSKEGPDLNLLLAPAYAWIYRETHSPEYRRRADEIFQGGIDGAWLNNGKQFSQNYRWSFDYVRWRKEGDGTSSY